MITADEKILKCSIKYRENRAYQGGYALFFCAGFNILSIFVTFRISKFNNFVTNGLKYHCIPTIIDGEPIMMEEM
jgi:hypothetical protein